MEDRKAALRLEFRYPFGCMVVTGKKEDAGFRVNYRDAGFNVTASLVGERFYSSRHELDDKVIQTRTHILFELSGERKSREVASIEEGYRLDEMPRDLIYEIAIRNVNRVLRNLRIYAFAANVHEEHPRANEAVEFLRRCSAKVDLSLSGWLPIVPEEDSSSLSEVLVRQLVKGWSDSPLLEAKVLGDVVSAIEEGREPFPEEEFLVNAMEFARERDFRMAVVESVIALEIVLAEFLREYYKSEHGYSGEKVGDLLSAGLGLWNRIAAILRVIMSDADLKGISLERVLQVVTWRNHVVHKAGRLPDQAREEHITACLIQTWNLLGMLRAKIQWIEQRPRFRSLTDELRKELGIKGLWISPRGKRKGIRLDVQYMIPSDVPSETEMKTVAETVLEFLSESELGFDPKGDFYARFSVLPNRTVARYSDGVLTKID
jgi:hypothetical protein